MPPSSPEHFVQLIADITSRIQDRKLDDQLQDDLNRLFPAHGFNYAALFDACLAGIEAGWMCSREGAGIRFGRVIKAGEATHGFSVDVVDMPPLAGPHHRHPNGEIDLIMPVDDAAQFDGCPAGWLVYGPNSAHRPTVTGGRALVLYLLPAGAIEFSHP